MRKKTVNAVDEKVEKAVDDFIGASSNVVSDSKKPGTIKKAVDSVAHGAGQAFGQKIIHRRMPKMIDEITGSEEEQEPELD